MAKDWDDLKPHQQRVALEKVELDEKLNALDRFMQGGFFAGMDEAEKARMVRQAAAMRDYSNVLGERLEAF